MDVSGLIQEVTVLSLQVLSNTVNDWIFGGQFIGSPHTHTVGCWANQGNLDPNANSGIELSR